MLNGNVNVLLNWLSLIDYIPEAPVILFIPLYAQLLHMQHTSQQIVIKLSYNVMILSLI